MTPSRWSAASLASALCLATVPSRLERGGLDADTPASSFGHGTAVRCALTRRRHKQGGTTMTDGVLTTSEISIRSALKPALNSASRSQPISRFQEQEHLAQAHWHVSQMKTHIVRQRIRVKHARDTGQPSQLEDSMLHALEASLYAFERHRELIVSQLKRRFSE